ncbi:hypothetical protein L873DRAFT_1799246 [Choiromyces venosus 120613-1]|uniref:Uncharacterized protein n=1 Tax=Choiromyces venosus 120613-1 TaxID=1336337 RepID=A0A3N4K4D4_9PEZI|nr:hypothetical protein L873DRAFT_1799246 [Choiromyces venosus 120613-1]
MAYKRYFSSIILALSFMTTLIAAAPTNDCAIGITKKTAGPLRLLVIDALRAVSGALGSEPLLAQIETENPTSFKEAKPWVTVDKARSVLQAQRTSIRGREEKAGEINIPQGWSDVIESKDKKIRDDFTKELVAGAFIRIDTDKTAAKKIAEAIWAGWEATKPGKGDVPPKRPDTPPGDKK